MVGQKRDVTGLLDKVELDSAQWPCIGFMRLVPGQLYGQTPRAKRLPPAQILFRPTNQP
jgi:hypothetical protein